MSMPPHSYISSLVCSCTCCEAPTQGHIHNYTIHTCAPKQLQTAAPVPTWSTQNLSTYPQTPRHRCTHTPKYTHHTNQTLAKLYRGIQALDFCPNCTYRKIFILTSHLHIHLHWEFHMDVNPNTDPQILLHTPTPGQQPV